MAVKNSGTIYTGGHNYGRFYLKWWSTQDTAANKTTVYWEAYAEITNSYYEFLGNAITLEQVIVAGKTVHNSTSKYSNLNKNTTPMRLDYGNFDVPHNNTTGESGDLKFYLKGGLYYGSPTYYYYDTGNQYYSFSTIPRAPQLAVANWQVMPGSLGCNFTTNLDLSALKYQLSTSATATSTGWTTITDTTTRAIAPQTKDVTGAAVTASTTYYLHLSATAAASGLTTTTYFTQQTGAPSVLTAGTTTRVVMPVSSDSVSGSTADSSVTLTYAFQNPYQDTGQKIYCSIGGIKVGEITNTSTAITNGITTINKKLTKGEIYKLYQLSLAFNSNSTTEEKCATLAIYCDHCGHSSAYTQTQLVFTKSNCGPISLNRNAFEFLEYTTEVEDSSIITSLTRPGDKVYTLDNLSSMAALANKSRLVAKLINNNPVITVPNNTGTTLKQVTIFSKTLPAAELATKTFVQSNATDKFGVTIVAEDNRGFAIQDTNAATTVRHTPPTITSCTFKRLSVKNDITKDYLQITMQGNITAKNFGNSNNLNRFNTVLLQVKSAGYAWPTDYTQQVTTDISLLQQVQADSEFCFTFDIGDVFSAESPGTLSTYAEKNIKYQANNADVLVYQNLLKVTAGVPIDVRVVVYDTYLATFSPISAINYEYHLDVIYGDGLESTPIYGTTFSLAGSGFLMTAKKNMGVCFGGLYNTEEGHALQLAGMPVLGFVVDENGGVFDTTN